MSPIQNSEQKTDSIKKPAKFDHISVTGSTFYERVMQTPAASSTKTVGVKTINAYGQVLDAEKKPVVGAIVILRNGFSMSAGGAGSIRDIAAKTKTDSEGRYQFENAKMRLQFSSPEIVAFAESGEMGWSSAYEVEGDTAKQINVSLNKSVPLNGVLTDDQGNAIEGVDLKFLYFRNHRDIQFDNYAGYTDRVISPVARTNNKGEFSFPEMPDGFVVGFRAMSPNYPSKYFSMRTSDAHPPWINGPAGKTRIPIKSNGDTLTLEKGKRLALKIVDKNSAPIKNAKVGVFGIARITKPDGIFKTAIQSSILENKKEIACSVSHKQYGFLSFQVPTADLIAGTAVVTLEEAAEVTGKIAIKESGQPIAGLTVHIDNSGPAVGFRARTDSDGRFKVKTSKGNITLKISGRVPGLDIVEDYRSIETAANSNWVRKFAVKAGEKKELETIFIDEITPLPVSVVDKDGEPIAGARVRLLSYKSQYGSPSPNSEWSTTEMDGQTELLPFTSSANASLIEATYQSEEGLCLAEAFVKPDKKRGETTQVKLLLATQVRGKITVNGKPISGVELKISKSGEKREAFINGKQVSLSGSRNVGNCVTDENGEYVLSVMPKGGSGKNASYFVGARSGIPNETTRNVSGKADLVAGEFIHNMDFFKGESKVGGTVVDINGKPIPQVKVTVRPSLIGKYPMPFDWFLSNVAYTDANGKFTIEGAPKDSELRLETGASNRAYISLEERKKYEVEFKANSGDTSVKVIIPIDQNSSGESKDESAKDESRKTKK
ncbi:MAG: hypothetical protein AB8B55_21280 [Mariniblastus sp.]